jgi:hypothetical protein
MTKSSPSEIKKSMDEWIAWKEEAEKKIKFEFGLPLKAVARILPDKVADIDTPVGGYSTIESESQEEVTNVLRNHPLLQRKGSSIDVLEMLPIDSM